MRFFRASNSQQDAPVNGASSGTETTLYGSLGSDDSVIRNWTLGLAPPAGASAMMGGTSCLPLTVRVRVAAEMRHSYYHGLADARNVMQPRTGANQSSLVRAVYVPCRTSVTSHIMSWSGRGVGWCRRCFHALAIWRCGAKVRVCRTGHHDVSSKQPRR